MSALLPAPKFARVNGIRLAYHRAGKGTPVLLLHGFPAIAMSLHHQFNALVMAGYTAIAPDQRGFGMSDCPKDVAAYRMTELVADLVGLLDSLAVKKAWVVGHDWGGGVAWQFALRAPERVLGIVSLGTILFPRPVAEPIAARRASMGDDNYVVAFQEPGRAEAVLDKDIGRSVDFMFRKNYMTIDEFAKAPLMIRQLEFLKQIELGEYEGEAALTVQERAEMIAAFTRTGYGPGINWYRNITRNWQENEGRAEQVTKPAIIISGADDYLSPPAFAAASKPLVPMLSLDTVPGGHWFPLEAPDETNAAIMHWLAGQATMAE